MRKWKAWLFALAVLIGIGTIGTVSMKAEAQNLNQGREKPTPKRSRHKDSGNMRFIIMTICIVIGVLAAAGALIYISLLFLY